MLAFDNHVVDDNPAADARAQSPKHQAGHIAGGPDPILAIGGGVGVVLENRRFVELVGHQLADGQIVPARQIVRMQQHPAGNVHRAGRGHADGGDFIPTHAAGGDGLIGDAVDVSHAVFGAFDGFRGPADVRAGMPAAHRPRPP